MEMKNVISNKFTPVKTHLNNELVELAPLCLQPLLPVLVAPADAEFKGETQHLYFMEALQ